MEKDYRLWLGSDEECCDQLVMPALGLGKEKAVCMPCICSPGPSTGEAVDGSQEVQSQIELVGRGSLKWEEVP